MYEAESALAEAREELDLTKLRLDIAEQERAAALDSAAVAAAAADAAAATIDDVLDGDIVTITWGGKKQSAVPTAHQVRSGEAIARRAECTSSFTPIE